MRTFYKMLLLISFLFLSCSPGVKNDSQHKFTRHKKFLKEISFSGYISGRKFCEKCKFDKYQIIIDLNETYPKEIDTSLRSFESYYSFNEKNQLILSVTRDIHESALNGLVCKKLLNSDNLIIVGYNYSLLSSDEDKWLIGE